MAVSQSSARTYAGLWRLFERWCAARDLVALPTQVSTLVEYFTERGRRVSASTIDTEYSAIRYYHRQARVDIVGDVRDLRDLIDTLKREKRRRPRQAAPLRASQLREITKRLPSTLDGYRDAALLWVGYAGALRRGELVAVHMKHLEWVKQGVALEVPHSKTDQYGKGIVIGLPFGEATRALDTWLGVSVVTQGAVFRALTPDNQDVRPKAITGDRVSKIVKRSVALLQEDPTLYSGHSLRAGWVTDKLDEGWPEIKIVKHSRHESIETLRKYYRADPFQIYDDSLWDG